MQESVNFPFGGPDRLTGAHDPLHALQRSGGVADQWYMDDGDTMCHPILVLPFLQEFDVANARVGAQRNLPENRSDLLRERPGSSAEDPRRAEHGQNLHSYRWKHHPRSRYRISAVHRGPAPGQGRRRPSDARTRPTLPGPADGVCPPPREFGSQPHQPHPAGSRPHNPAGTEASKVYDEMGQRSLERLFSGLTEDSTTQASDHQRRPVRNRVQKSARHRCTDTSGGSHCCQTAHPGCDPRRSLGGPSPGADLSAHLTMMSKPRQSCMFRRQLRQQTKLGSKPSRDCRDRASQTRPLHPLDIPVEDNDDMDFSAPQKSRLSRAAAPSAAFTAH